MIDLFSFIAIPAGLFVITCLARYFHARQGLRLDAEAEYGTRQSEKPATIKSVSKSEFIEIYLKSHEPGWALYAALGVIGALLATPIALALVVVIYTAFWHLSGAPDWGDRTGYVYMFSVFFGIVLCWSLIAAFAARRLHMTRPEPFQHALARARGEPMEAKPLKKKRPKWARKVRPDPQTEASKSNVESET